MLRIYKPVLSTSIGALFMAGCAVTPDPLEQHEILNAAIADRQLIEASQQPLTGPLDLAEATARALKFNLGHRVQIMEEALANESFELAKFDMLPVLSAEGGATVRDKYNASRSESLATRRESLEPSFSEDRFHYFGTGKFSWNILDFGVSYLQARQESNRYLVAQLARKKAMLRMTLQVRIAYWRAAALQRFSPEIETLLAQASAAREDLEQVLNERLRAPVEVLEEIRALAEIVQQLENLQQSVNAAEIDLASLINAPVGKPVKLRVSDPRNPMPQPDIEVEDLELLALANNTDYTAELYNIRMDRDEARKSILRLLPGVELFSSVNYDSNSYLVYNHWYEAGARVNWNIMRLLAAPQIDKQNDVREMVTQARRLAANMGAITQLHISWREYQNALARLDRAAEIDAIDSEIRRLADQAKASRALAEADRLRNNVRALRSKVARTLAYVSSQEAYGKFLNSLGLSPIPIDYQMQSVEELASTIRVAYDRWSSGRFPDLQLGQEYRTGDAAEPAPQASAREVSETTGSDAG